MLVETISEVTENMELLVLMDGVEVVTKGDDSTMAVLVTEGMLDNEVLIGRAVNRVSTPMTSPVEYRRSEVVLLDTGVLAMDVLGPGRDVGTDVGN